jgi:predicted phage gp36 major capsid-like protein
VTPDYPTEWVDAAANALTGPRYEHLLMQPQDTREAVVRVLAAVAPLIRAATLREVEGSRPGPTVPVELPTAPDTP